MHAEASIYYSWECLIYQFCIVIALWVTTADVESKHKIKVKDLYTLIEQSLYIFWPETKQAACNWLWKYTLTIRHTYLYTV